MTRASVVIRIVERVGASLLQALVGLAFMGAGGYTAWYGLQHEQQTLVYVGLGVALLGAMVLPSIFPVFQRIIVFVAPYLPLVGGRRKDDPPAAPPAPGPG